MARLLVLVATEPPLTRETIAVALQQVRPDMDTIAADPAALAEDIARYHPDVAITSQHHATVEARVPSWVQLSADGGNAGVTSVLGRRQEREHLRFADLVAVVDQTPCVAA
jgi:hypothetical protein